jgi:hypothetical protein
MSEVVIVDAKGNEHVFPAGFDPKKAAAIVRGDSTAAPAEKSGGMLQTAKDLGIGALKGVGSSIASIGEMAADTGLLPGMARGGGAMRHPAFTKADEATTASNSTQGIGKGIEQVAEMAIPTGAAANAVPRVTRAGKNLQKVMAVAKNAPVNMEAPGQAALRIQQLASRGGTEPRAIGKLLRRITDPEQGPIAYEEGRDWYGNISRLSADEFNRLPDVVKREMGGLREAMHSSLTQAAETVGQGNRYAGAIKEYGQAKKLQSYKDALVQAFKKGALPAAGIAGAGGALAYALGSRGRKAGGGLLEED